jgi:hypothetical protein
LLSMRRISPHKRACSTQSPPLLVRILAGLAFVI